MGTSHTPRRAETHALSRHFRPAVSLRSKFYYGCAPVALRRALAGLGMAVAVALPAVAQSVTAPVNLDLGSVLATGNNSTPAGALETTPGTAPYEAPSVAPLNSSQPTSLVNQNTIENNFISSQSYADIAKLTPSVSNISPNGPGLQESDGPVIRGFQDGQYNVTFDGIPIGDSNDFTHHTTSFFTTDDIGETIVDRGPGTAETVGDATFGGTISIRTVTPNPVQTLTPFGEFGSYDTNLGGVQYDTGVLPNAGGISAVGIGEHLQSNGALTHATQERSNFFGKVVVPLGANTTVTFLADYNKLYQNPAIGATDAEMAAFGNNFAYSDDPNQQNYYRYNTDHITTDMEYVDIQSNLGDGLLYDGKLYTYAYYHRDLNGDDPNDQGLPGQFSNADLEAAGAIPNLVSTSPGGPLVTGVPGENFTNSYRSLGTIQRIEKDFGFGDVKTGFWFDHQVNTRAVSEVILTDGNAPDYAATDSNGGALQDRLQHNQLYTFQPYAQFDYKPIDGLTLTGGVKYAFFKRALDAVVQQKTEVPTGYEHNYDKLLPSFEATYDFTPNVSAYVQAAEGFLAPNLNTYYTPNIASDSLKPQSTLNFQAGTAYQDEHLALGADAYTIHFQNFINSKKVMGNTVFFNQGGVIYRGLEGEATYTFDNGFSLFVNAGYNQAFQTSTNDYITQAPQYTTNFGVIYDKDGVYASVIDEDTGGEYSGDVPSSGNQDAGHGKSPGEWYDPYNVVNVAAGYTFNHVNPRLNQVKVKVNVDNITDQHQIIFDDGTNALGQNLNFVLPGVAAFVTVSVPITF
jgi:iron complex outermembrane receptor protein